MDLARSPAHKPGRFSARFSKSVSGTTLTRCSQPGGKVRVTLTIAQRFADRIRRNSEARIVTQGLLGDKLVELTIGSVDSPPLRPGEHLTAHEPLETGRVLAEAGEALASVKRLATALNVAVDRVDRNGTLDQINKLAGAP